MVAEVDQLLVEAQLRAVDLLFRNPQGRTAGPQPAGGSTKLLRIGTDLPDAPASRVRRTRGLSPTSRAILPPLRSSALALWMMQRNPTDARNEPTVRSTSTAIGRVAANAVKGNSISPTPIMSSRPPSDPAHRSSLRSSCSTKTVDPAVDQSDIFFIKPQIRPTQQQNLGSQRHRATHRHRPVRPEGLMA